MTRGESLVQYLRAFLGTPYYWPRWDSPADNSESKPMQGNDDPILGFTCSGFVSMGLRREIVELRAKQRSLSVQDILDALASKVIWRAMGGALFPSVRPGDLIVYGDAKAVYHVAVVADAWHIIEAGGGAAGVDTPREQAAANAFVQESPADFRATERKALIRIWED